MSRIATAGFLALALAALLPEAVWACPVCFDPREENRLAFLATTALLTLLPLGMVAGTGLWLRRRAREIDGSEPEADGLDTPEV